MAAARTRDPVERKAAILAAARLGFAADGYDRTTIRTVAKAADVDPALVMHYFGSKHGLFEAAAQLDLDLPDLQGISPERYADTLLPYFVSVWRPDGPFLGLLRAAASNPAAARTLLGVFVDQVAPALAAVAVDRADRRAALVGSQLIGLAVTRHVVGLPPLVGMGDEELARWLRPVLAHYLTGELDEV